MNTTGSLPDVWQLTDPDSLKSHSTAPWLQFLVSELFSTANIKIGTCQCSIYTFYYASLAVVHSLLCLCCCTAVMYAISNYRGIITDYQFPLSTEPGVFYIQVRTLLVTLIDRLSWRLCYMWNTLLCWQITHDNGHFRITPALWSPRHSANLFLMATSQRNFPYSVEYSATTKQL